MADALQTTLLLVLISLTGYGSSSIIDHSSLKTVESSHALQHLYKETQSLVPTTTTKPKTVGKGCKGEPSQVMITDKGRFVVNGKPFYVRSVGYSPIPPGKFTMQESFDYFVDGYEHIWRRDLPLIKKMGANVLRLWNWDATVDHQSFLDMAHSTGLMVLVPFGMTMKEYKDLDDPDTIRMAVMDWTQFVLKVKDHPAVFGYLIGNELNRIYGDVIDSLLSLVNQMVIAKNYAERNMSGDENRIPHPCTMPLSANNFLFYVEKYYAWLSIDFWSLQYYDYEVGIFIRNYTEQANIQAKNGSRLKPLLLSEFGADALQKSTTIKFQEQVPLDEKKQAEELCIAFNDILDGYTQIYHHREKDGFQPLTQGGSIMEWVDEWWKGSIGDVRHPLCPNQVGDMHTYCSIDLSANHSGLHFLYEEWLGIFEQAPVSMQLSRKRFCVKPRPAYCMLMDSWGLAVNNSPPTKCNIARIPAKCSAPTFNDPYITFEDEWVCANRRSLWLYPEVVFSAPVILIALTVIVALINGTFFNKLPCAKWCYKGNTAELEEGDDEEAPAEPKTPLVLPSSRASEFGVDDTPQPVLFKGCTHPDAINLKQKIQDAFAKYCYEGQFFTVAQERLFTMIWDRVCMFGSYVIYEENPERNEPGSPSPAFITRSPNVPISDLAIRTVFEQYMEAYYLYLDPKADIPRDITEEGMLSIMSLYIIVQQWSGTITHSPEKVLEVFAFAKVFLEYQMELEDSPQDRVEIVQEFHHGLVEIFRVYYLIVDNDEGTYDDLNLDALANRKNLGPEPSLDEIKDYFEVFPKNFSVQGTRLPLEKLIEELKKSGNAMLPEQILLPLLGQNVPNESDHPCLQYHLYDKPVQKVKTKLAKSFFQNRAYTRAFPLKGGIWTVLFNYSWVVRLLIWMFVLAWYVQPIYFTSRICLSETLIYLCTIDSTWKFMASFMEYRVLGRLRVLLVFSILINLVAFLGMAFIFTFIHIPQVQNLNEPLSKIMINYLIPSDELSDVIDINACSIYLGLHCGYQLLKEFYKFVRTRPPNGNIPGRKVIRQRVVVVVRATFAVVVIVVSAAIVFAYSYISSLSVDIWVWPSMVSDLLSLGVVLAGFFLALSLAGVLGRVCTSSDDWQARSWASEEVIYLLQNSIYWGLWLVMNFFAQYKIVIPAVVRVRIDICYCNPTLPSRDINEEQLCLLRNSLVCYVGVIFLWTSAILVNFAITYGVFILLQCLFGFFHGKMKRVGNVQGWQDVVVNHFHIICTTLPKISYCFNNIQNCMKFWNQFIDELHKEYLLTAKERDALKYNISQGTIDINLVQPRNQEAKRRIISWLWSLEAASSHPNKVGEDKHYTSHRVFTMPSLTVLIPAYNETILFTEESLQKHRVGKKPRITELEYLCATYWDEWENFTEHMKSIDKSWVVDDDNAPTDLLHAFLGYTKQSLRDDIAFYVRLWASLRGQTLARTICGLVNSRNGLLELARMEEPTFTSEQLQELVHRKLQILVSHQTYKMNVNIKEKPNTDEEAMAAMFLIYKHLEVAINVDTKFKSYCRRLRKDILVKDEIPPDGIPYRYFRPIQFEEDASSGSPRKKRRRMYKYPSEADYEDVCVQRVARLKIGEGKAENQIHAMPFARHTVLQAFDMNQYATFENAHKIPFALHDYFGIPPHIIDLYEGNQWTWETKNILPRVRLLGFPEWTYTRSLGMIGELMGCAEFSFVTICHRVMNWPLRQRLHYGHPDWFDGFWVRTRGGSSKASRTVNTNEDIFAGYEILARGECIDYIEFVDAQKGRESAFNGAYVFEAKLAQGAAQQCRSWDVYLLNQELDIFMKLSLFNCSLAFYVTNLIMTISIDYYILAIVMYALSQISYHQLGLLDAVIAIPWLLQVGYILAIPMFCELVLLHGVLVGLQQFLSTLPMGLIFFVFHLRTKMYYFGQGLLLGKGGYAGTGRNFGLDRMSLTVMYQTYAESHFHQAVIILLGLIFYAAFSGDPFWPYIARCFTITLIFVSWMFAPLIFNPMPTMEDLQTDIAEFVRWIGFDFPDLTPADEKALNDTLKGVHEKMRKKQLAPGGLPAVTQAENSFWGRQHLPSKSWMAWYYKETLIKNWVFEDQNFPRSPTLIIQKLFLTFESFIPWIFLTYKFWHLDSIYYLLLVLLCLVFFGAVDWLLKERHDLQLLIKSIIVLSVFPAYQFLMNDEDLYAYNLCWSFVSYVLVLWILVDMIVGFMNLRAKSNTIGLLRSGDRINKDLVQENSAADEEGGDTVSEDHIHDCDQVCKTDELQLRLLIYRLKVPRYFLSVRKVLPIACLTLLVFGNFICVLLCDMLTSLQFNSRVAEAWKKAYLRAQTHTDIEEEKPTPQLQTHLLPRPGPYPFPVRGHRPRGISTAMMSPNSIFSDTRGKDKKSITPRGNDRH